MGATGGGHAPRTSALPAAQHYETGAPSGSAFLGPVDATLAAGVASAAQATGRHPTGDPRLAALAAWALAFFEVHGRFPEGKALDFETHRLGMVEPVPSMGLLGAPDEPALREHIADQLTPLLEQGHYTHVGAASARESADGPGFRVVFALSTRPLTLKPLPVAPSSGDTVTLRGSLVSGYRRGEMLVVQPDGRSIRKSLPRRENFALDLPFVGPGTYRVELLASGPHGATVVANFPIHYGIAPPAPPSPTPMHHGKVGTPEAMRSGMLDLVNDTREEHDLPPLSEHVPLQAVARAHNQDMLRNDFIGHESPTTGSPEDRVHRAGIDAPLIAENVGRSYSLEGVHEGLMASPGHRENILHRDATHVGIDVQATPRDGRHEFLVTEVFIRVIPELSADDAERVLDAINGQRDRQGARALEQDAALARLATRAAADHFSPNNLSQQQIMRRLSNARRKTPTRHQAIAQVMTMLSNIDRVSELPEVLDPDARAIGIGLAQGQRKGAMPGAIAVVLLIGY